jgi:hypothetical protein
MLLQLLSPFETFLLSHKNQTVVALQNQMSRRNAGQVSNGNRKGQWKHNLLALRLKMKWSKFMTNLTRTSFSVKVGTRAEFL